ncbi:MAG: hypothetical protein JJE25_00035 [Bacteroidia bacterium]|nr:hypothetical protein [Bacteroidia bacterium]
MPKPNSVKQIIGTWTEKQWENEIVFSITENNNVIIMTHLINKFAINGNGIYSSSFDEHEQIILKSDTDHYVVWNVENNFLQIDKLEGPICFRFNLKRTGH